MPSSLQRIDHAREAPALVGRVRLLQPELLRLLVGHVGAELRRRLTFLRGRPHPGGEDASGVGDERPQGGAGAGDRRAEVGGAEPGDGLVHVEGVGVPEEREEVARVVGGHARPRAASGRTPVSIAGTASAVMLETDVVWRNQWLPLARAASFGEELLVDRAVGLHHRDERQLVEDHHHHGGADPRH